MEKWVNNLENTEPGNYYLKDEDANEPANIVFCIDTRSIIDDEAFEAVKSSIKEIAEDAFDRYVDIKVYIYYQKFGSNFKVTNNLLTDSNTGENYFTDFNSAEKALNGLEKYLIKSNFWAYDYTAATQYILDTCDENIIAMYHIVSDQRVMGSADKTKRLLNSLENDERVYVSTICPFSDKTIDDLSYAVAFAEKTNGIVYTQADFISFGASEEAELIMPLSESENYMTTMSVTNYALSANKNPESFDENKYLEYMIYMRRNIMEILGEGIEKSNYTIISSTGSTKIKLDTALKPQIYYEVNNIEPTDTDKDNLSDWDEVNIAFIKHILTQRGGVSSTSSLRTIKNEDLPTIGEYRNYYDKLGIKYDYVEQGYRQLVNRFRKSLQYVDGEKTPEEVVNSLRILPIISNPVDADSDNDGIIDLYDKNPFDKNIRTLKNSTASKEAFTVVKCFDKSKNTVITITDTIRAFSIPKEATDKEIGILQRDEKITVHSFMLSGGEYWIKAWFSKFGVWGYVLCDNVDFDYKKYVAPENQTSNPNIGSNIGAIFNMWYFPVPEVTGVKSPVPLYYQYYFIDGNKRNSLKCTLLSSVSGYYCATNEIDDPQAFLDSITESNWTDSDGIITWMADMSTKNSIDEVLTLVKKELDAGKPILVGANEGKWDHLVIVVGYRGNGDKYSDYIVLDSCKTEFSNLEDFYNEYPYTIKTWDSLGRGYAYGTFD